MTPEIIARLESAAGPKAIAALASIAVSAPAGPTILNLLEENIAAIIPAHTAVIIPLRGEAPDATAIEIESGIDTRATVIPAFQFEAICPKNDVFACDI